MRKITLFIMLISVLGVFAQNRPAKSVIKDLDRHMMAIGDYPINHTNEMLRNTNMNVILDENFDAGIPSTWTVVDNLNAGGAVWAGATDYQGDSLDGTPFAFADSDAAGQLDTDTELISPEVDTSGAVSLFLSFDQFFKTYTGADSADVDVFDGTQWTTVYTTSADVGAWGNPDYRIIDVTAYKNANFKVRFHYYNANWEYYWAIDNFKVYEPDNDDLAMIEANPGTYMPNMDFTLDATVFNLGLNTQNDFDVTFDIVDSSNASVFNETVNITGASMAPGEKYFVAPTNTVNLPIGQYTLNVTVALGADADNSNDTYTRAINIVDYASTYQSDIVYSYIAYDADQSGDNSNLVTFDNAGNVNAIGALNTSDFLIGGTFINDLLVGIEYGTNLVYFIDGNGNAYPYRKFSGDIGTDKVTGIAFDGALNKVYVTSGVDLFEVDSPNLHTTLVGALNASGYIIGMDFDSNGTLYGIALELAPAEDALYSIDTVTGGATSIGPLGVDIRFAQDIGSVPSSGALYGTLYVDQVGGGLYSIDKMTGAVTLIGMQQQDEYTVCAIKDTFASISENQIEGLKVYPNPTNDMIYLTAEENILSISITDMTGKEVMSVNNDGLQAQINLSTLPTGNYIMKITTDKTVGAKQIIKR